MKQWNNLDSTQKLIVLIFCMALIGFMASLVIKSTRGVATGEGKHKSTYIAELRDDILKWAKKHKVFVTIVTSCKLATSRNGTTLKDHCVLSSNPLEVPWIVICEGMPDNRVCYRGH